MTVIRENTMEARSPRSGLSSRVRMNVTTQTTFRKNNGANVIDLPGVINSNRQTNNNNHWALKCTHHVNFVGPPQCRDVQKLLHHAMEVDIDDGGQHSLGSQHRGLRNILALCNLFENHYSVNKIHPEMNDMDAFVRFFFFLGTFGKSSKRKPIQSVIKRITIAERAPATCSDTKKKLKGRYRVRDEGKNS